MQKQIAVLVTGKMVVQPSASSKCIPPQKPCWSQIPAVMRRAVRTVTGSRNRSRRARKKSKDCKDLSNFLLRHTVLLI
jgi:hypothetical protein